MDEGTEAQQEEGICSRFHSKQCRKQISDVESNSDSSQLPSWLVSERSLSCKLRSGQIFPAYMFASPVVHLQKNA